MKNTILIVSAVMLLCACGETPQTAGAKQDAAPYSGTGKPYVQSGWKQGDKASWESQLKARGQNTQNEYSRSN